MTSQFEQHVMQELPLSVPYDERSVLAAMHDDRVVSIQAVKQAHQASQQSDKQTVEQHWQALADKHTQMADQSNQSNQSDQSNQSNQTGPTNPTGPTGQNNPTGPTNKIVPVSANYPPFRSNIRDKVLRHAAHMFHDIKHYSKLGFDSHQKKLKHCFVEHNRIFVSSALIMILLFVVILVVILTRKSTNI
jgi:hypothetical protein